MDALGRVRPSARRAMLDIALQNSRQHCQFQHGAGPVWIARGGADGLWTTVDADHSADAQAMLEIVSDGGGIQVHFAGSEPEFIGGRWGQLSPNGHLDLPAEFSIGDTRFEISDAGRSS